MRQLTEIVSSRRHCIRRSNLIATSSCRAFRTPVLIAAPYPRLRSCVRTRMSVMCRYFNMVEPVSWYVSTFEALEQRGFQIKASPVDERPRNETKYDKWTEEDPDQSRLFRHGIAELCHALDAEAFPMLLERFLVDRNQFDGRKSAPRRRCGACPMLCIAMRRAPSHGAK